MVQMSLSEKRLQNVIDAFLGLIGSIENDDVRVGLNNMMEHLGERFFEAPASAKLEYHNCFVGGLAEHSLRVYGNLKKLRDTFCPDISDDSIILVALCHDLGKVGSIDQPYYIEQESEWHRDRLGEMYAHNPKIEYMAVSQRSLRLLGQFNVPLTDLEYKAILISDGQYIIENKSYQHKEGWLGLLLHQADMIACKAEVEKWRNAQ